MSNLIPHKRGDTFSIECTYTDNKNRPIDMWDISVKSQVRNQNDRLLSELVFFPVDLAQGKYRLVAENTENWTIGCLNFDIQYMLSDGRITSTDTQQIECYADVTR